MKGVLKVSKEQVIEIERYCDEHGSLAPDLSHQETAGNHYPGKSGWQSACWCALIKITFHANPHSNALWGTSPWKVILLTQRNDREIPSVT